VSDLPRGVIRQFRCKSGEVRLGCRPGCAASSVLAGFVQGRVGAEWGDRVSSDLGLSDCCFGLFGTIPLSFALREVRRLEAGDILQA
jgi:hypothetical protein